MYRKLLARGMPRSAAAQVAGNAQRWWRNSGMAINMAFPVRYYDDLGLPRLAT